MNPRQESWNARIIESPGPKDAICQGMSVMARVCCNRHGHGGGERQRQRERERQRERVRERQRQRQIKYQADE